MCISLREGQLLSWHWTIILCAHVWTISSNNSLQHGDHQTTTTLTIGIIQANSKLSMFSTKNSSISVVLGSAQFCWLHPRKSTFTAHDGRRRFTIKMHYQPWTHLHDKKISLKTSSGTCSRITGHPSTYVRGICVKILCGSHGHLQPARRICTCRFHVTLRLHWYDRCEERCYHNKKE